MEIEMKSRTKQFGLRTIRLIGALPNSIAGRKIGEQLLKSATSVGANYRAACHARSKADFVSKLGIVEEEADESAFWLEMIIEAGLMSKNRVQSLFVEAEELTRIMVASRITAGRSLTIKNQKSKIKNPS